jgi:signal transduction histidine kinase
MTLSFPEPHKMQAAMVLKRHWWAIGTSALLLVYAGVAISTSGFLRSAVGDITQLALVFIVTLVMAANAISSRGQARLFWLLMSVGCFLWGISLASWAVFEVFLRQEVPDPFLGDIILFVHVVPFMAAVALRPHRPQEDKNLSLSTLNFLMLLVWWIFLYTFIVCPDEYVILNPRVYGREYDLLYLFENLLLLTALGWLAANVQGAWKKIYWNLFLAAAIYTWSSEALNVAIARRQYSSGGWYDIPLAASLCWFVFAGLAGRDPDPACDPAPPGRSRWLALSPRLAMLAILSLPIMGAWSQFIDTAPPPIRHFRLLVTLAAMLVLGVFLFLRQYLLDRELMRLLEESRKSFDSLKRLQSQVVQREKLASLGELVAGAAHEINNPVAAILGYSELLSTNKNLDTTQLTMARKIGQQARRTRDLVSGLLRFAQQVPAEKAWVDVGPLVQRSLQMKMLQLETKGIRVQSTIPENLPRIWGNANQLMQGFLEIIGNAMDAMADKGGGTISVTAVSQANEVVLEFADSGPGMQEPGRVFDPFYTTKPIGKGTGLGLSATYGMVQDHAGQIGCHNRAEGGAVFVLRFPTNQVVPASEGAPMSLSSPLATAGQ